MTLLDWGFWSRNTWFIIVISNKKCLKEFVKLQIRYNTIDTDHKNRIKNKLNDGGNIEDLTVVVLDYNNEKTKDILYRSLFIKRLNKIKDLDNNDFICGFDDIISDFDLYDISGETLLTIIIKEKLD